MKFAHKKYIYVIHRLGGSFRANISRSWKCGPMLQAAFEFIKKSLQVPVTTCYKSILLDSIVTSWTLHFTKTVWFFCSDKGLPLEMSAH